MASATMVSVLEPTQLNSFQAKKWADKIQQQLSLLGVCDDSDESLPSSATIDETIMKAPRRKAADPEAAALANKIAQLLYPSDGNPLGALIKYEKDIVRLRRLVLKQRKCTIEDNTKQKELYDWGKRILKQGPWNPSTDPLSLGGAPSLPMPVRIAEHDELASFFEHLSLGGTEKISSTGRAAENAIEIEEAFYNVKSLEFERGVLYSDRRMDLCKMVVGPTHIGNLLESLKTNEFVSHFLLGNNIIGPHGANCIANFLKEYPNRIDTWYLAGNCIDTSSIRILVDELINSTSVTNIWLKRNPLMSGASQDIFRLITQANNLRTLDLDQTELGDTGIADLFSKLGQHVPKKPLAFRNIYLNANGISAKGATAIAQYLASPQCRLEGLYLMSNPLGNTGVMALAAGLKQNKSLKRLTLSSIGMSDEGAITLCEALYDHPTITALDIGQHFATPDLNSRYAISR